MSIGFIVAANTSISTLWNFQNFKIFILSSDLSFRLHYKRREVQIVIDINSYIISITVAQLVRGRFNFYSGLLQAPFSRHILINYYKIRTCCMLSIWYRYEKQHPKPKKMLPVCYFLTFFLCGKHCFIEVLENSCWFSSSHICFTQQTAVPHVILRWQRLIFIQNSEQWLSYRQLMVKSHLVSTNVCPKCVVKQLWTWVSCENGEDI